VTKTFVFATRNAHKVDEVRRILRSAGVDVDLIPLPADAPEVVESGASFAANALIKARSAALHTGLAAIADDSGLCVDALHGMPGIHSARWSGRHGDDAANVSLLLGQLAETPAIRRGAQFVCAAVVVDPQSGTEHAVEGVLEGQVIDQIRGAGGFGYDPIFIPDGQTVTTAEMTAEDKDAISHRGKAFRALAQLLD
jgi:XTP/dITP diphosphohydrolase